MNTNDYEFDILLSKIEKMWRRANHPNTPEAERKVAEAKAIALMEQNRIEMSMLALADEDVLGDHEWPVKIKGSYGRIQMEFIQVVAEAYDCRIWWRNYGMTYTLFVTGYASDFRRVQGLVTFLLADAMSQAAKFKSRSMAITKDYRRSFVQGYYVEIRRRLHEAKQFAREAAVAKAAADEAVYGRDSLDAIEAAEQRVTGAEVVLAEKRQRVTDFYKTKKLRTVGGSSSGRSSSGHRDGRIAGQNADLGGGRNRVGSGTKALGR